MSLQIIKDLIRQYNLTGTPQEVADALNAKTVDVPYSELVTSTGVILELGPDMARQILAAFQTVAAQDPLLQSQLDKLNSTGIDFSHPLTRQMIDDLVTAGVFTAAQAEALKGIGMKKKSLYEMAAGDGAVVAVEDVAAALNDNPEVSKQVLVSVNRGESGTAVTVMINELHDGRPSGISQVFTYRTGGTLPDDPIIASVISQIVQAVSAIEV